MFDTVQNQRIFCISGKEKCDTEHIYAKINKEAILLAMRDLKPVAFELWIFLSSQQHNYMFAFSPAAVAYETGMKKSSIQNAVRELIEGKYLIQRDDGSNIYDFYEIAKGETEDIEIFINELGL